MCIRDSPYSVHPIEVANILTDLKLDSATITTGLLHDTIEDTYATYETIKGEFGNEVADLVDGVTKISVLENKASSNSKAENFRKLILATSKDIRVLLVKIADRLHNMRTIKAITKEEKRMRIAQETMEIYAPLADRMGMHRIRDELEDLSFEILNLDARKLIQNRLNEIKKEQIYICPLFKQCIYWVIYYDTPPLALTWSDVDTIDVPSISRTPALFANLAQNLSNSVILTVSEHLM